MKLDSCGSQRMTSAPFSQSDGWYKKATEGQMEWHNNDIHVSELYSLLYIFSYFISSTIPYFLVVFCMVLLSDELLSCLSMCDFIWCVKGDDHSSCITSKEFT